MCRNCTHTLARGRRDGHCRTLHCSARAIAVSACSKPVASAAIVNEEPPIKHIVSANGCTNSGGGSPVHENSCNGAKSAYVLFKSAPCEVLPIAKLTREAARERENE